MPRKRLAFFIGFGLVLLAHAGESKQRLEKDANLTVRGWADPIGFCQTAEEIDAVFAACRKENSFEGEINPWVAAICPHDDHLYAGPVYQKVLPGIRAKHIVLLGVAHKAWRWGVRDRIIFDAFDAWKGPKGPVEISPLREELLAQMNPDDVVVSNAYHQEEHSLEGLIPFIQAYNPEAQILPLLVPHMEWPRLSQLARDMAKKMAGLIHEKKWHLADDVAILISNDCVHYGDKGWGDKNFDDFGVDRSGYEAAVKRDLGLVQKYLAGTIDEKRLRDFLYELVQEGDVSEYRIPWCGRFSVPFGLAFTFHLSQDMGHNPPSGRLLQYATSVEPGKLPIFLDGLGVTAPASLRHWVGYVAIGYR